MCKGTPGETCCACRIWPELWRGRSDRHRACSLWLGVTAVAVALAGMITILAAIRAQLRRRADAAARRRVSISASGITFYRTPAPKDIEHFPWQDIASLHLAATTFILQAGPDAPKPGRHAIRFGKLVTPRSAIISAMDAGQAKIRGAS
jgi:hypothetical protein